MSLQAKISDMPFDQKFFQPQEVGVSRWRTHTDGHTDVHCGQQTESASGRYSAVISKTYNIGIKATEYWDNCLQPYIVIFSLTMDELMSKYLTIIKYYR